MKIDNLAAIFETVEMFYLFIFLIFIIFFFFCCNMVVISIIYGAEIDKKNPVEKWFS